MSYLLDDQGSNAWEDIFPSEREERERKQKIRQKIQILEVLRELEREGSNNSLPPPAPPPSYYHPPPPYYYYPPPPFDSCPVVENMKVSITSDPLDKIYTDKDKSLKKKAAFHGKVHTINDLPKEDFLSELFGKEKEKEPPVVEYKTNQNLFNAGRRVRDGAIVYQAPSVSSAMSWFSSPNFEIFVCISLVIIFFGILIGKYIGDSAQKTKRRKQAQRVISKPISFIFKEIPPPVPPPPPPSQPALIPPPTPPSSPSIII